MNLHELGLSTTCKKVCALRKIYTLKDLSETYESDMGNTKGCGRRTMNELKDLMWRHGISFKERSEIRSRYTSAKPSDFLLYEMERINERLSNIEKHFGINL
jgi:DNA-directed RNA polymerase alpha subunit